MLLQRTQYAAKLQRPGETLGCHADLLVKLVDEMLVAHTAGTREVFHAHLPRALATSASTDA